MIKKGLLCVGTGIVAIAMATVPAVAAPTGVEDDAAALSAAAPQDEPDQDEPEASEGDEDVLVVGIRGSIETSRNNKRDAKQIKEVVTSEDAGKLPDNNVTEAISRVPGVQLDRVHGEGSGIQIRGLSDIQTTVNGNDTSVGEARSINLSDIPAELLKSVEVYKTRTADQVEGGIAGTVNVELRRPLDLKKGLTAAGSIREVYSDIGETWSPYGSALLGYRFDTGAGEIGFLLNGSYTENRYEEGFVDSESPSTFFGQDYDSLPASQKDIIAPYAINYGVESGTIKRPSFSAVAQWRPSDNLDFVLEGSYFGSDESRGRDRLHLVLRNGNYSLSNITLAEDGRTVQKITVSNPNGINGGPESYSENVESNLYQTNFETHWHGGRATIDASAQYNWSDRSYFGILQVMRLRGNTSATADLNSDLLPGGGPFITFNGTDLANPASYGMGLFHDEQALEKNHEFASQVNLTLRLSDASFLRSLQTGVRFSTRYTQRDYGYRDAGFFGNPPLISTFPGAELETTTPNIRGFDAPTWYHLSGPALLADYDAVRDFLQDNAEWGGTDFATARPSNNRGGSYTSNESTFAAFAQFNYAFDLGVPVDGVAGVRYVNTWGKIYSADYRPDPLGGPDIIRDSEGQGNYVDILPSVNAIIHFTPKLQLRLAYTFNTQRPSFFSLRPFAFFETRANPPLVFAGNPDLRPNRETSYDASLEYYFGRAGSITLAGYIKKPDGFLYYSGEEQFIPQLGVVGTVFQERNAGPGEFQGIEVAAQTFFDFLPGIWKNFGASANFTYIPKFRIGFPFDAVTAQIPGIFDAPDTSKYTANAALYYDSPMFSARVAYNYRSERKSFVFTEQPAYSPYVRATSRLDAAVNYTPFKFVTFSVEGTNLLRSNTKRFFGLSDYLPLGPRVEARTVQLSARFRF